MERHVAAYFLKYVIKHVSLYLLYSPKSIIIYAFQTDSTKCCLKALLESALTYKWYIPKYEIYISLTIFKTDETVGKLATTRLSKSK